MAYAEKKTLKGGKVVYYAVYIGPDGRRRTAGSFAGKCSERRAHRSRLADQKARQVDHMRTQVAQRAAAGRGGAQPPTVR